MLFWSICIVAFKYAAHISWLKDSAHNKWIQIPSIINEGFSHKWRNYSQTTDLQRRIEELENQLKEKDKEINRLTDLINQEHMVEIKLSN